MPKKTKISENPSLAELGNVISTLKPLAGIANGFRRIGLNPGSLETLEDLISESTILDLPDKFNAAFASDGWILVAGAYSQDMVTQAIQIHEKGQAAQAEAAIINWFNETNLSVFVKNRLKSFEAGRARYEQINEAIQLYAEERYLASVPLILIICDGFASDLLGHSPFAQDADLSVFDSVVGHESGLPTLIQMLTKTARKTRSESIALPERHKILHGRALGYGNKAVCAKAWGLLLALIEWANDKSTEQTRITEFEDKENVTFAEVLEQHRKVQADKELIDAFKSTLTQGPFDLENREGSPEQAVFEFLSSWQKQNYGKMAQHAMIQTGKSAKHMAGDMRNMAEFIELEDFELQEICYTTIARCDVKVWVRAKTLKGKVEGAINILVFAHQSDGKISDGDYENATWRVQQFCIYDVMNSKFI